MSPALKIYDRAIVKYGNGGQTSFVTREGVEILTLERLSMTFTANGKMKFSFRQNKEKLDLFKLLSCLLPRYME